MLSPTPVAAYEPEDLYSDLGPDEAAPAVGPLVNDQGLMHLPYYPLLVRTPDGLALIDTGAGLALAEEWGEPVGRLDEALGAAGVAADDIGLVLLSHAHPDHIGGLTTENESGRRLVFPRARPRGDQGTAPRAHEPGPIRLHVRG